MKIVKHADGRRTLRMSKTDVKKLSKTAGWQDDFSYLEEDDEDWTDVDLADVDIEDVLSEMEDEEVKRQLLEVEDDSGDDPEYIAKCEEAMSILSPVLEDLTSGQWLDPESVVNDLADAVGPLMENESDVDIATPLVMIRKFVSLPDRPEDEELKRGIRMIMEKAGIPLEESVETLLEPPTSAAKGTQLGFCQSSDLWYKILKTK